MSANVKDYANYSFWLENSGDDLTPRPPLDGSAEVDVAILGAGFTGLWTAYDLLEHDPSLNMLVVDKVKAGCGCSKKGCSQEAERSPAYASHGNGRNR